MGKGVIRLVEIYDKDGNPLDKYWEVVYNNKIEGPFKTHEEAETISDQICNTGCRDNDLPEGTPIQ